MRKEIIVAIVFGVLLGLTVAVVMVVRVRQFGGQGKIPGENQITPKVAAKNTQLQPLEITAPGPDTITDQNKIAIKGKALKDSLIIIESPINDLAVKNAEEDFSINFPLSLGENIIAITAYPKDPKLNPQSSTLRVYYLTEE